MRVFLERGLDDARDGMTESGKLRQHLQHAVPDLLQDVWNTIRTVDLYQAGVFINGSLIPVDIKRLAGHDELGNHAGVVLCAEFVSPRIVPPPAVQPGNVLPRRKRRIGGWSHRVAV